MINKGTAMTDLITRLTAATEPSRKLDAEIVALLHDAIVKPYPPSTDFGPSAKWQFWSRDGAHFLGNESKWPVPHYTASLDAAMTLVPEDCHVNFGTYPKNCTYSFAKPWAQVWREGVFGRNESTAPTAALALCIAALRATRCQAPMETPYDIVQELEQ